jgi:uncharacterized protein YjgD (DUF1641 family)
MTTESDTRIADALDRVLSRLDALERKVDGLTGLTPDAATALNALAGRLPAVMDAAGTTAQFAWDEAEKRGIHPVEAGLRAADALPHLVRLLDRVDLLEKAVDRADLAGAVLDASAAVDPALVTEVVQKAAPLLSKLSRVLSRPELGALLDAVDGATLGVAAQATSALVEGRAAPSTPVGPIKAFFALGEPDVQRAVGFALAVARKFGQRLA